MPSAHQFSPCMRNLCDSARRLVVAWRWQARQRALIFGLFCLCLSIEACTSVQLESSTTALGPSIYNIERDQIYANLGVFIDACKSNGPCNAVPNQFVLGGGQAQVSNQVQFPNITANFQGLFVKSTGLQNQNQWTQAWAITPVTDFSDLERLRALYQLAISLSTNSSDSTLIQTFVDRYTATQVKSVDPNTVAVARYVATATINNNAGQGLTVDQIPIPLPDYDGNSMLIPDSTKWRHALPNVKWVYWEDNPPPKDAKNIIHAGRFSNHDIYIDEGSLRSFMLWVVGATANTNGGGGKGGGPQKGAQGLVPPIPQ
jgi:hypothetical protein